jgi:hypothetical protein
MMSPRMLLIGGLLALAAGPRPDHWSLAPLARPAVPAVRDGAWVRNPIDAFILARLEAEGMKPSPPADPRTLLRRVTFDLTGLPPTPDEIDRFAADPSPGAYEAVVDRLLASPRHGEHWARHWLDVAHYADTHGHDQDKPRPNAWPYRDYVIRSLNDDKPYARFVQEQIAGDVLFPDDSQATVALGFLAAGPWDESSLRDIKDDTIDKKKAQHLDRDDMLVTALGAFMSTTIGCAQCHDHKFDPISQVEYYRLQSVFAGVDRAERPYDPDPQVHRRRRELASLPVDRGEVEAWEQALRRPIWTTAAPVTFSSSGGATLEAQSDGSLRSGGARPERDTVTIAARTELVGITAARLEVMTDPSLPKQGPGRQDNGNLHLSEIRVMAVPAAREVAALPVAIAGATADFNQDGWGVERAIDGDMKTAWGIFPEVGKPHEAVFRFREPVGYAGGTILIFILEQQHGDGHLIGRARLSVTTEPDRRLFAALPGPIGAILAVAPDQRTEAQSAALTAHYRRGKIELELDALPRPHKVYAAASDFEPQGNFKPARGPRPIHRLLRGDIHRPAEEATPGALSCVPGLSPTLDVRDGADEGERRAALARWITDARNVLTWRSIVNRVWHYHFGRGIVDTPGDLGVMGGRPSHPELLDWLAVEFRDGGGSLKRLHRLIVTSAAYRQSSESVPAWAARDGENRLLWRMNRRRLDAEEIRDALSAIGGTLDLSMGGPPARQFLEQGKTASDTLKVDYERFDVDSPESRRRAVYRFIYRTVPDPFLETLDCPDGSQAVARRSVSVTSLQALALMHDRYVVRQSERLAERVASAGDVRAQAAAAFRLALGRAPEPAELEALAAHAEKHGTASACRIIFNTNEFVFVR